MTAFGVTESSIPSNNLYHSIQDKRKVLKSIYKKRFIVYLYALIKQKMILGMRGGTRDPRTHILKLVLYLWGVLKKSLKLTLFKHFDFYFNF